MTMRYNRITLRVIFLLFFSLIPAVSTDLICDEDEHVCESTLKCISKNYLCDGDNDCGDFSDESVELCKLDQPTFTLAVNEITIACEEGMFSCSGMCIRDNWICDGDADCINGEDEDVRLCTRSIKTVTRSTTTKAPCLSTDFDCGEKCIELGWVCDGQLDCDDESDEAKMLCSTTALLHSPPCTSDEFDCGNGCVSLSFICDGRRHCINGNDESEQLCSQRSSATLPTSHYPTGPTEKTTLDPPWIERRQLTTSDDKTETNKAINVNQSKSTTTPKISVAEEDCDPPKELVSIFSRLDWVECMLIVLGLLVVVIATTVICIKRKKHSVNLNSRVGENQAPMVSYLNSPATPECHLVLVSSAVRLEPTLIQTTTSDIYPGQPPPYNNIPEPSNQKMPNFKSHECLM